MSNFWLKIVKLADVAISLLEESQVGIYNAVSFWKSQARNAPQTCLPLTREVDFA